VSAGTQPLVSIVTPVYNGEAFLEQCIESVLQQTYGNWEYVILDNASTDRTPDIIAAYAEREPRIRALGNPELLPQIPNWNRSMQAISPRSTYCKVVHADDLLFAECLERMVAVAERHPSVVIVGAYRIDGQRVNMTSIPFPQEFVPGRELCRKRLLGQWEDLFGSPTSLLYRAAPLRARGDTCFKLENPCTDTELCFELLRDGDYGFVHQVLTMTRRHTATETTAARASGVHSTGRTMIARDLGACFLNPQEHRYAMALQLGYHDQFLARNPRKLLDREFRAKTRALYRSCGMRLNPLRISALSARYAARGLLTGVKRRVSGRGREAT